VFSTDAGALRVLVLRCLFYIKNPPFFVVLTQNPFLDFFGSPAEFTVLWKGLSFPFALLFWPMIELFFWWEDVFLSIRIFLGSPSAETLWIDVPSFFSCSPELFLV